MLKITYFGTTVRLFDDGKDQILSSLVKKTPTSVSRR